KLVPIAPNDRASAERLLRHYRELARLRHPNVVSILDVGESGDSVYVIMPLAEEGSLSDRLHRLSSWPTPRAAADIVRDVARGLQHLHEHGLVHLDVKPSNVLIGPDGRLLVADFGLSQRVATARARVRGTPAYMSPEQCQLREV